MSFEAPLMLLGLPLIWLVWRMGERVEAVLNSLFAPEVFAKLANVESATLLSRWRRPLFYLALAWFVVALSKPILPASSSNIKVREADILIALDLSHSMSADDIAPTRLAAARERINAFLNEGRGERFGVVGFSRTAFPISPMTSDSAMVRYLVDSLKVDDVVSKGTDIGVIFPLVAKMAKNTPRILVILSDGGDSETLTREIEVAKQMGVTVYAIGLATPQGATLRDEENQTIVDAEGNIVLSVLNPALEEICLATGGRFEVASAGDVTRILGAIRGKFEAYRLHDASVVGEVQLFMWPLMIGIILFFLSRFEMPTLPWKQAGILLLLVVATRSEAGLLDFYYLSKAQSAWAHGRYEEAVVAYEKLVASHPNNALLYNLGASYYKTGAYEKAIAVWGRIRTSDSAFLAMVQAAMGNALALRGEYRHAERAYRESLRRVASPAVAHNLEIVKKLEEEYKRGVERPKQGSGGAANTREAEGAAGGRTQPAKLDPNQALLEQTLHPKPLSGRQIYLLGGEGAGRESRPW
ncbi:MAG: VWA domain-containing protein [Campylobacterales bacterium]